MNLKYNCDIKNKEQKESTKELQRKRINQNVNISFLYYILMLLHVAITQDNIILRKIKQKTNQ